MCHHLFTSLNPIVHFGWLSGARIATTLRYRAAIFRKQDARSRLDQKSRAVGLNRPIPLYLVQQSRF